MQCFAQISALQHPAKPRDLVWRLQKRVLAVDGDVLSLDGILDFLNRCGRDIPDPLNVPGREQQVPGIDVPLFDEAAGLFRAAAGVLPVYQPIRIKLRNCS